MANEPDNISEKLQSTSQPGHSEEQLPSDEVSAVKSETIPDVSEHQQPEHPTEASASNVDTKDSNEFVRPTDAEIVDYTNEIR